MFCVFNPFILWTNVCKVRSKMSLVATFEVLLYASNSCCSSIKVSSLSIFSCSVLAEKKI